MKEALQYLLSRINPYATLSTERNAIALSEGMRITCLEQFQEAPDRIRATAHLASSESFCEYINRFKGEESSVYLDVADGVFTAVLDHHGKDGPTWRDHLATFKPKRAMEWVAWTAVHEQWLTQINLALHIERLLHTIQKPEPNKVLQAALDFQANEKLIVASTQNLDDGTVRFNFQKDNATKTVTFPHRIELSLPVHENEAPRTLEARIRYKVDGNGVLGFKCSFVQDPEAIERNALLDLAAKTREATEGLAHYEGSLVGAH